MTSNRDDDEPSFDDELSFDLYRTLKKRLETNKTQKEMTQVRSKHCLFGLFGLFGLFPCFVNVHRKMRDTTTLQCCRNYRWTNSLQQSTHRSLF